MRWIIEAEPIIDLDDKVNNVKVNIGFYLSDVSHDIASSENWCQCLDKKVQGFSVVKQNSNMRISK